MKTRIFISVGLLFLLGCNGPDTPCDCHETISNLNTSFSNREIEFSEFDPDRRSSYADDVLKYKEDLQEANEVLRHCKDVYNEQGTCTAYGGSLWDIGKGYFLPDLDSFRAHFTGDWVRDSTVVRERENAGLMNYLRRERYSDSFPQVYYATDSGYSIQPAPADSFVEWYRKEVESMK